MEPLDQAQEESFIRRVHEPLHLLLVFNNWNVTQIQSETFGNDIDSRLTFKEYLERIFVNVNREIYVICELQPVLPRSLYCS